MKKRTGFLIVIIYFINIIGFSHGNIWASVETDMSEAASSESSVVVSEHIEYPEAPEVHGESVILMEADTGAIIYERNSHEKLYPASITKIMTGLLTIENCSMEDIVTYERDILSALPYDAAKLGLVSGEEMTVKDSLYSLMLRSSNDVAVGLAYKISGSEEEFAKLMTERAKTAGAVDTNFANSTGLHDVNHYTTAYDMAMITRAAITNPIFYEISGTDEYVLEPTNKCTTPRTQKNRHEMLVSSMQGYYSYAVAGKTGYTDEAGRTLVTVAKRDGKTFICVFMKTTDEYVFNDTKLMFEYGFNHFNKINIAENETRFNQNSDDFFSKMSDIFINTESLFVLGKSDYCMLPEGVSIEDLTYRIEYATDNSNGLIADVEYYYGDRIMGNTKINLGEQKKTIDNASPVRDNEVENETIIADIPINIWLVVLGIFIVLAVILYIAYMIKTKEKRKRNRERKKMFKESKNRFKRRKRQNIKFR